jgi:hypothetical protein
LRSAFLGRLDTVFQSTPDCSPPGGAQAARGGGFDVSLVAQETATWPERIPVVLAENQRI